MSKAGLKIAEVIVKVYGEIQDFPVYMYAKLYFPSIKFAPLDEQGWTKVFNYSLPFTWTGEYLLINAFEVVELLFCNQDELFIGIDIYIIQADFQIQEEIQAQVDFGKRDRSSAFGATVCVVIMKKVLCLLVLSLLTIPNLLLAMPIGMTKGNKLIGYINHNCVIDIDDLNKFSKHFGSSRGEKEYRGWADINKDDIVDIEDLVLIAINYGDVCRYSNKNKMFV